MLSKLWVRDPGSRIRQKPIPDAGVKGHRIPDPVPQHCLLESEKFVFLPGQEASRLYRNFQRDAAPLRQPDVHLSSLSNPRLSLLRDFILSLSMSLGHFPNLIFCCLRVPVHCCVWYSIYPFFIGRSGSKVLQAMQLCFLNSRVDDF